MLAHDFIRKYASNYYDRYVKFSEATSLDGVEEFKDSINGIANLIVYLVKEKNPSLASKNLTFDEIINGIKSEFNDFIISSLHFFRITRNNIIHDTNRNYDMTKATMSYLKYIVDSFISTYAKTYYDLDIDVKDNFSEDTESDAELSELNVYENRIKRNLDDNISDYYQPEIKPNDIDKQLSKLIYDYLFHEYEFDQLTEKYGLNGKQINETLIKYGFTFNFVDTIVNVVKEEKYMKSVINDFFSNDKLKQKVLDEINSYNLEGDLNE